MTFEPRESGSQQVTRLAKLASHGPLRVQRPFYPEGSAGSCHVYLLHPPGGLVSGDALEIEADVRRGARVLLTTPAAAKVYAADRHGVSSAQRVRLTVQPGGVLEYLPQQTIVFDGARGRQVTDLSLASGSVCVGWESMALGRPASNLPFAQGLMTQQFRLCVDGRLLWHERQALDPDRPAFRGLWGLGGCSVQSTLWAVGLEDPADAVAQLRATLPLSPRWGVTERAGVMLMRYLGHEANEAWSLCEQAWTILRPRLVGTTAVPPRIWRT
ncbi:MAG: urease accessory protein UreD [Halothiobacillaceae bacterium]